MRVVVRTTTGSPADSTSAVASSAGTGSTPSDGPASAPPEASGSPAPATGSGAGATGHGTTETDAVAVPDAEGTESRPRYAPADRALTCHGYSEGQHGLKLTDANGEKCGYVPYHELLRVVPE